MIVRLLANSYFGLVLLAGLMHMTQGVLISFAPHAETITSTYIFALLLPINSVGPIFVMVGGAALTGLALKMRGYYLAGLLSVVWQQSVLFTTMFGVLLIIKRGQFADGYEKAWQFIAADQSWLIYLALLHFLSLLCFHYNLSGAWWSKRLSGSA